VLFAVLSTGTNSSILFYSSSELEWNYCAFFKIGTKNYNKILSSLELLLPTRFYALQDQSVFYWQRTI